MDFETPTEGYYAREYGFLVEHTNGARFNMDIRDVSATWEPGQLEDVEEAFDAVLALIATSPDLALVVGAGYRRRQMNEVYTPPTP